MPRLPHGMNVNPEMVRDARKAVDAHIADVSLGFAMVKPVDLRRFDFLFLELQDDPDNLLPLSQTTVNDLVDLGEAMTDTGGDDPAGDLDISAAFTYFGQFVDHDITFDSDATPGTPPPAPENLEPLPLEVIREQSKNLRTGLLELDSVYGEPAPKDPHDPRKMLIGKVSKFQDPEEDLDPRPPEEVPFLRPDGKADENDLPREPRNEDFKRDRAALIGDLRNDENTIIAQLHVAFLLAHNKLVDEAAPPNRFKKAKRRLRRHYQYIILHDFLKKIADPQIVDDIIETGSRVYDPDEDEFFMPLEFSVVAFRFGHSMVRAAYDFNSNFNKSGPPAVPATLFFLFTFTALSGQLGFEPNLDTNRLPEKWIIEWENFFDPQGRAGLSKARRIDTELVEPLAELQAIPGGPELGLAAKLAVRNLLRGYLLRMPTGQAVAHALRQRLQGVRDIPVLTPKQIEKNAEKVNKEQAEVLRRRDGEFLRRTPLWYYILAEAAILRNGQRLGPVGSTIVAEVLIGLIRCSPHSILDPESTWQPNLPTPEKGSNLADLLRFAGVLT